MAAATLVNPFKWLDQLENEFDRCMIDIDVALETALEDEDLLLATSNEVRLKLQHVANIWSQLVHKSIAVFQANLKFDALLTDVRTSDLQSPNSIEDGPHSALKKLEKQIKSLEKESETWYQRYFELEEELVGARLAARYLDKELAGRVQQIQLLSRSMNGPEHDKLWNQLEAEIHLSRHKTIIKACRRSSAKKNGLGDRADEQHTQPLVRFVRLEKDDEIGIGIAITGGRDRGVPVTISDVYVGSPAQLHGIVVGDAILSVNAIDMRNCTHEEAVAILQNVKDGVVFELLHIEVDPTEDDDDDLPSKANNQSPASLRRLDGETTGTNSGLTNGITPPTTSASVVRKRKDENSEICVSLPQEENDLSEACVVNADE